MLIILSPAKRLDYKTPSATMQYTQPAMLEESKKLIKGLKKLKAEDISQLMKVSDKIAALNVERYNSFSTPFTPKTAKQAVLAFQGDVYVGLCATRYIEEDFAFAQAHLRILSGLYGVLRPLDLMQPYRLEMGTKYANSKGNDLYAFWGNKITEALNAALEAQEGEVLINLASTEYFKAVRPEKVRGRILTPVFKEKKEDGYKIIGVMAKKARGVMADFIIQNRLHDIEKLKEFTALGYEFNKKLSNNNEWVFTHD